MLRWPPLVIWLTAIAVLVGMPLLAWGVVGIERWSFGDSPAGRIIIPFSVAIAVLHSVSAVVLAALLFLWRSPAAPAVAITALWLEYPVVAVLYGGLARCAASLCQTATVPLGLMMPASAPPLLVTIWLLTVRPVRRFYRIDRTGVDAPATTP